MNKRVFVFPVLALSLTLAACAAPDPSGEKKIGAYEERYVPTGTMFANKDPKRTDATKFIDKDSLEQAIRQSATSAGGKM